MSIMMIAIVDTSIVLKDTVNHLLLVVLVIKIVAMLFQEVHNATQMGFHFLFAGLALVAEVVQLLFPTRQVWIVDTRPWHYNILVIVILQVALQDGEIVMEIFLVQMVVKHS
jgi:hypothetical protein